MGVDNAGSRIGGTASRTYLVLHLKGECGVGTSVLEHQWVLDENHVSFLVHLCRNLTKLAS